MQYSNLVQKMLLLAIVTLFSSDPLSYVGHTCYHVALGVDISADKKKRTPKESPFGRAAILELAVLFPQTSTPLPRSVINEDPLLCVLIFQ